MAAARDGAGAYVDTDAHAHINTRADAQSRVMHDTTAWCDLDLLQRELAAAWDDAAFGRADPGANPDTDTELVHNHAAWSDLGLRGRELAAVRSGLPDDSARSGLDLRGRRLEAAVRERTG